MNELDFYIITAERLVLAAFLGGIIGYEREKTHHDAGLRTHMLVCMGACLMVLISLYIKNVHAIGIPHDPSRIAAGVITGVGFLGAGAIMKDQGRTHGLTTAATIWISAALGLAVGVGFTIGALFSVIITLVTLTVLRFFKAS